MGMGACAVLPADLMMQWSSVRLCVTPVTPVSEMKDDGWEMMISWLPGQESGFYATNLAIQCCD